MAELTDPDVRLLRIFNDWGNGLDGWAASVVTFLGEYGLAAALVLMVPLLWLMVRRRPDAPQAVAMVAWAPLAAAVAYGFNQPISALVARPRPFLDHDDIVPMLEGKGGWSFVSDHSSAAMAIAVGLLLVHRKLGLVAVAIALSQGVLRLTLGVHYPSDVVGGIALATAVTLLLMPLAVWALTPLLRWCGETRGLSWIAPGPQSVAERGEDSAGPPRRRPVEKGLAA